MKYTCGTVKEEYFCSKVEFSVAVEVSLCGSGVLCCRN